MEVNVMTGLNAYNVNVQPADDLQVTDMKIFKFDHFLALIKSDSTACMKYSPEISYFSQVVNVISTIENKEKENQAS